MARRGGVLGLLAFIVISSSAASAEPRRKPRTPEHEAQARRGLAEVDPALERVFDDATAAMDADRTAEARVGFDKILARLPDHAATLRRAGYLRTAEKDYDEGIALSRRALAAEPGTVGETALAAALIAKPDSIAARNEAQTHALRAIDNPSDDHATPAGMVAAQVALKINDLPLLKKAVVLLEHTAPEAFETHYLSAIQHLTADELDEADAALTRAVARGMPAKAADEMREEGGINRHRSTGRIVRVGLTLLGSWVGGLLLLFGLGLLMSHATLRAVERFAAERSDALVVKTRVLRRIYKAAIGVAAVYYFLSLPIIAGIVLTIAGLAIYGILQTGYIPFKILAIILIVSLVTAWSLLRSLFVRRPPDEDPGPRLTDAEAPALWALAREVAAQVGTRPVDSIFITPGTDLAVAERGTVSARLRDHGHRFLILGVGVLEGMTRRQLSAILAHEYGHFSNRDTAGGDVAVAVRSSLFTAIIGIAQGGGASLLNPAWHFLRLYFALFQRVAHGSTRLQETLADRFAVVAYGGPAFVEGLRHTVERTVRFKYAVNAIVTRAEQQRRAIANLYVAPDGPSGETSDGAPGGRPDIEQEIAAALNEAGSPYDSHPPIPKRIAWVAAFGGDATAARAPDGPAWDLFPDRAVVEGRMTAIVNQRMTDAGAIDANTPPPVSAASAQV